MSVYGRGARGGHAVVEIMAGIGRACPRLRDKQMTSVAKCPASDLNYCIFSMRYGKVSKVSVTFCQRQDLGGGYEIKIWP